MNEGYTPELDKSKMDKSFAVQPSDTIGFLAMLAPNINEEELAKNIQLVIDNVRELFHNDEMAERVLREPLFARRVLEGEPISAYALFDAVREVGKGDPAIAAEMVTHLHAKGAMRTVFNASGAVRFIGESEEEKERMRLDRMLYIALNKAGFREGELVKESMDEVMVARAIRYANELRASCGLDPIGLQEEDYRLMSEGALGIDTNGAAEIGEEEVHATKARSPLSQLRTIVHESVHFASDTSITYNKGDEFDYPSTIKTGLQEKKTKELGAMQLGWFDEAVTEELAARYVRGLSEDDPDFGEIVKNKNHALERFRSIKEKISLSEKNILTEEPIDVIFDNDGTVEVATSTYKSARASLWELCADIYRKSPGMLEGKSVEDVKEYIFAVLVKAKFTGNTVPFVLLYDSTFGKSAFANALTEDSYRLRSMESRELHRGLREDLQMYKDENFSGAIIVREGDTGYAIRKDAYGNIDGNHITYSPDGTIGAVYRLRPDEVHSLEERGIVDLALFGLTEK